MEKPAGKTLLASTLLPGSLETEQQKRNGEILTKKLLYGHRNLIAGVKKIILSPVSAIILVARLTSTIIHGKKIVLICQMFHISILLGWINVCHANSDEIVNISYRDLMKQVHRHEGYGIQYNPSKSAAIVDTSMSVPVYINFKTKKTYVITSHWPGLVSATWLNDLIALVKGSCGTGCARSIIFIAPSTVVSCAEHEYRIENLDRHYPPDFRHNTPLLIDVKKGIYVCYDANNNIQIFPLPNYSTIRPMKGFYSEKAEIQHGDLIVIYENGHGKIKRVSYGTIR